MAIRVGIVGGTGYTGAELLRLLARHPAVELEVITSRSEAGRAVAELFPNLRGHLDLAFSAPDPARLGACDCVFFATPNGTAMRMVPELLAAGSRVVDLAADFRLRDPELWARWYGEPHACPELLPEAVYGLPELNREAVRRARLVANPGCYPTAVTLGFLPLVEAGLVEGGLVADAKSGVSGAGRGARVSGLYAEVADNFHAYGVPGHRHLPEIRQTLAAVTGGEQPELVFVPHLVPMIRGIHATLYARVPSRAVELQDLYEARYASEPWVDVMPAGSHPETRSVRGTNGCRIAVHRPQDGELVVVLAVIDNLVKGAAGQAVQNMNLMFGRPEDEGLQQVALLP